MTKRWIVTTLYKHWLNRIKIILTTLSVLKILLTKKIRDNNKKREFKRVSYKDSSEKIEKKKKREGQ